MSITPFAFSPVDGLLNTTTYPQKPANQTAARTQLQDPHEQEKNYINNTLLPGIADISGWTLSLATFSYASADAPTFVMSTTGNLTTNFYPKIKVKLFQDGVYKYFICTLSAYTSSTAITMYGGTDYTLTSSPITNVSFSTASCPYGFPVDPTKWTVEIKLSAGASAAGATAGTWYNISALNILIPLGLWRVELIILAYVSAGGDFRSTLSTANNSASDVDFVGYSAGYSSTTVAGTHAKSKILNLASKTQYYLNLYSGSGGTGLSISAVGTSFVRAICAYL